MSSGKGGEGRGRDKVWRGEGGDKSVLISTIKMSGRD